MNAVVTGYAASRHSQAQQALRGRVLRGRALRGRALRGQTPFGRALRRHAFVDGVQR
jgi:hypothetical protein